MSYGFKRVSSAELDRIVKRVTSPTRASSAWRYNYDAQATHVNYLKQRDPKVHPRRSVGSEEFGKIIQRLTRPTTASRAATWDFDSQDANLLYLRSVDSNIRLPLRTMTPDTTLHSRSSSRRSQLISVDDAPNGNSRASSSGKRYDYVAHPGRKTLPGLPGEESAYTATGKLYTDLADDELRNYDGPRSTTLVAVR